MHIFCPIFPFLLYMNILVKGVNINLFELYASGSSCTVLLFLFSVSKNNHLHTHAKPQKSCRIISFNSICLAFDFSSMTHPSFLVKFIPHRQSLLTTQLFQKQSVLQFAVRIAACLLCNFHFHQPHNNFVVNWGKGKNGN